MNGNQYGIHNTKKMQDSNHIVLQDILKLRRIIQELEGISLVSSSNNKKRNKAIKILETLTR